MPRAAGIKRASVSESLDSAQALDEVDACIVVAPEKIDLDTIAFPSMKKALELYMANRAERSILPCPAACGTTKS